MPALSSAVMLLTFFCYFTKNTINFLALQQLSYSTLEYTKEYFVTIKLKVFQKMTSFFLAILS